MAAAGDRPPIRLAHSPDADDAFMLFGLASRAVDPCGLDFRIEAADIETLNARARDAALDVTAASFAAWPSLSESYDLLGVGSSFGLGYGPKLVAREPLALDDLRGRDVAAPGAMTSSSLLLRLAAPDAVPRQLAFDEIAGAVASGAVAAGVVIHEGQLTYATHGLHLVADLGAWWQEETGLPVPLGANLVRRALGGDVARRVSRALAASIRHALAHRPEAIAHAMSFARGQDEATVDRFVALYVNDLSLDPGDSGRRAVDALYERGAAAGLLPAVAARWAPA